MLAKHFTIARPEIVEEQISTDGTRKWLFRFPAARRRPSGRDRNRLYPGRRPRHAVHFQPGRLHAHLLLLPYRHAEAGAQPDGGRDPGAAADGARPARRFPGPRYAGRRHRAGRRPQGLQHRHDGHGRAALQFRRGQEGAADRLRRRRPVAVEAAHHAVDLRRRAGNLPHRRGDRRHAGNLAACGQRRSARHARADQQEISAEGTDRRLPRISRPVQCAPHHLRICDAEGRQRQPRRCQGAGASS